MYAVVKTGGKQYTVAPGDVIAVEKLPGEVGDTVELEAICVVDGDKVEADPAKAASTKVTALILDQFKDKKQLVFKFKKRKGYKKLQGHRQQLTRLRITAVGADKYKKKSAPKAEAKKTDSKKEAKEEATEAAAKKTEKATKTEKAEKDEKPAAKKPAAKKTTAKKDDAEKSEAKKTTAKKSTTTKKTTTTKKAAEKKTAEKKPAAKKPAAKKTTAKKADEAASEE